MIWYGLLVLAIIFVDLVTKQWALNTCVHEMVVNSVLSCQVALNRGVAWSLFHSDSPIVFVSITVLIFLIICWLAWYTFCQRLARQPIAGEVLVLAGASANFIDRIWHAGVVDFIAIGYNQYTFPLFNVADVAIVSGVFLMLVLSYRRI